MGHAILRQLHDGHIRTELGSEVWIEELDEEVWLIDERAAHLGERGYEVHIVAKLEGDEPPRMSLAELPFFNGTEERVSGKFVLKRLDLGAKRRVEVGAAGAFVCH